MMPNPILAMHIPDGFLSVPVSLVGWLLTAIMVMVALRQTRDQLGERQIPLMGVLAAFIFAAQMINFPVAGGTSGHLIGGALVAVLLGPWAAVLVMTGVVSVQALIFQDGGLLVMGFNLFNMAVVSPFVGYAVYTWIRKLLDNPLIAAAAGAWLSVVVAATATGLQLAISGTSPLAIVLPAMIGVHMLIGIGEALITSGALAFIYRTRPDIHQTTAPANGSRWVAAGILIALVVVLAAPLASPEPDGLERVAEDQGFIETAEDAPFEIIPDYVMPAIENEALATIAAGVLGVLVVAGLTYGVARVNKRNSDSVTTG